LQPERSFPHDLPPMFFPAELLAEAALTGIPLDLTERIALCFARAVTYILSEDDRPAHGRKGRPRLPWHDELVSVVDDLRELGCSLNLAIRRVAEQGHEVWEWVTWESRKHFPIDSQLLARSESTNPDAADREAALQAISSHLHGWDMSFRMMEETSGRDYRRSQWTNCAGFGVALSLQRSR
jgi:hypothetical protein